jgi:hypothetical protein
MEVRISLDLGNIAVKIGGLGMPCGVGWLTGFDASKQSTTEQIGE